MTIRQITRGAFWLLVGAALIFHAAGGWYYSGVVIQDELVPDPAPLVIASGDYRLDEVRYASELGEMEAWFLPAFRDTWIIHVHGNDETPAQAEFLFEQLQDSGYPQLAIAYRNDDGQPEDPSGYHSYGATESADVGAAVDYARENGAESVVLSGFGSGASHILSFVYGNNLELVRGIILDSPIVDMSETIDYRASQRELPMVPVFIPSTVSFVAKFAASLRTEINWDAIDYSARASTNLRKPVLVHHGTDDSSVPVSQSIAFAEAAPDLVRLIQVADAGNHGAFAADPEKYLEELLSFLSQVG